MAEERLEDRNVVDVVPLIEAARRLNAPFNPNVVRGR